MENASKAMLISGGVLVAMLVLAIGVYLFANYSNIALSYEQKIETIEIQKFNANFIKFEGRKNITIHEIVTLANFAKQYEKQTGTHIKLDIQGKTNDLINWLNDFTTEEENKKIIEELIKKYVDTEFELRDLKYDNSGKVKSIYFIRNT